MKLWFVFSAIESRNLGTTTTTAEPTTTLIVTTHDTTTNNHASDMTTTEPWTNTMKTLTLDYTTVHRSTVAMWDTATTTWFYSE